MATVEDPILPSEPVAEQPVVEVVEEKQEKADAPKEVKAKKVSTPRKRNSAHPPYFEMIKDAIVSMKDRTGSSQYAITKFIEDKQKNLPPNFRKLLLVQLKKFVSNDKLVKVKSSYKLPPSRSSKPAADAKPKPKAPVAKKMAVSKAKPKAKTIALKSKAKPKPKVAASAKAKPTLKRKAPEKPKIVKKPPAKAAKTSTRSTPKRGAASASVKKAPAAKKATPMKKAPAKTVKPKTVKSPAKKSAAKKGKK